MADPPDWMAGPPDWDHGHGPRRCPFEYEDIGELQMPTKGPELHAAGRCKPCFLAAKGRCHFGEAMCSFCHLEGHVKMNRHNPARRRKKQNLNRLRTPSPENITHVASPPGVDSRPVIMASPPDADSRQVIRASPSDAASRPVIIASPPDADSRPVVRASPPDAAPLPVIRYLHLQQPPHWSLLDNDGYLSTV